MPLINIGVTPKSNEFMENGKFSGIINVHDTSSKFVINKDNPILTLYISSSSEGNVLMMKEPEVIFNEENLITIFKGDLQKGGIIEQKPQILTLAMACKDIKVTNNDMQIKLSFDSQTISLFFQKECDTTQEIHDYFIIIRIIYWIFIVLIVIFIVVVALYYLKKNELTLFDTLEKIKQYIDSKLFSQDNTNDNIANSLSQSRELINEKNPNDENIDIKISTPNRSTGKSYSELKMDYGGI
jgi:hypothetical protein